MTRTLGCVVALLLSLLAAPGLAQEATHDALRALKQDMEDALNKQDVHVDLWFRSFDGRLGLVLLTVLLLGAVLGGLAVTAGVVWPMRRRQGRAQRSQSGPDANELSNDRGDSK